MEKFVWHRTAAVCGYTYDDAAESWTYLVCSAAKQHFTCITIPAPTKDAGYTGTRVMDEIHYMATTGKSITEPMKTLMPVPSFDEILLLGAQLARLPLDDDAPVNVRMVIGKRAKQPMVLETRSLFHT